MPEEKPIQLSILSSPSTEAIEKFKKIYKEKFGQVLDSQQALDLAMKTMLLVHIGTTKPPKPNAD